jgi:carbon monoxide dehydrogenase subunit G
MRTIEVERDIEAPQSDVWAVLADFPNIASWNTGVKSSFSTSDTTAGVGAKRHCDLAPAGALEETIQVWEPEAVLEISIDSARGLPIRYGLAKFVLEPGEIGTRVTVAYSYQPRFGFLGQLMGSLVMDGQLTKGFAGFLKDLDRAAAPASAG